MAMAANPAAAFLVRDDAKRMLNPPVKRWAERFSKRRCLPRHHRQAVMDFA